ncbi:MAG TPA: TIGR03087 family PEP-CTERM/XrtA system glycosyltransferase [Acidocella sp.]|jgi:sugar transferase (PEP-CTERM/EpsH1 system associated)|nr:TIGR03087 family PEP-CTERM/XrtA system glycosyltransferase [Acidocella sp.]
MLCHRIPFPPDKGDKIRAFHILKHLQRNFNVHLGCFYDDPSDESRIPTLRREVASLNCLPIRPALMKLRALSRVRPGKSLSVSYYQSKDMDRWIQSVAKHTDIAQVFVFSSTMAPYAELLPKVPKLLDMVDVDSEKFSSYSKSSKFPFNLVWSREGRTLLNFERSLIGKFDRTIFASQAEKLRFDALAPESVANTDWVTNGVDTAYFSPELGFTSPFDSRPAIVFTGTMDYRPNIEAVLWFSKHVLPALGRHKKGPVFYIVGANPSPEVRELAAQNNIVVTGKVTDVRPYLAHASVSVAPLRIGRGIQNKVLEAMAMARPVVVSTEALTGIDATPGYDLIVADNAPDMVKAISDVLDLKHGQLGRNARRTIYEIYSWPAALSRLDDMLPEPRITEAVL